LGQDGLGNAQVDLVAAVAANPSSWSKVTLALGGVDGAKGEIFVEVRAYSDPTVTIVGAKNLRNTDGFMGKSDPFARLSGLSGASALWGETVTVRDDMSPAWNSSFSVKLLAALPAGGQIVPLKVNVLDEDHKERGARDGPLGHADIPWSDLFPDEDGQGKEHNLDLVGEGAQSKSKVRISIVTTAPIHSAAAISAGFDPATVLAAIETRVAVALTAPTATAPTAADHTTSHKADRTAADHTASHKADHTAADHTASHKADHTAADHTAADHTTSHKADHTASHKAEDTAADHIAADHIAADHIAADHIAADHTASHKADRTAAHTSEGAAPDPTSPTRSYSRYDEHKEHNQD
jgi:hypothetical protein